MRRKEKGWLTTAVFVLALLMISAMILKANAAGSITLTPTTGEPMTTVNVAGTGFAADNAVAIAWGCEIEVDTDENVTVTGSGQGPWTGVLANAPIKPGSFNMTGITGGATVTTYFDEGDGTITSPDGYVVEAGINYTTGVWYRVSTVDLSTYTLEHYCDYTTYRNNDTSTPIGVTTTDGSGAFSVDVSVPYVWNGSLSMENVVAIDGTGNIAEAPFDVTGSDLVPEALTIGAIVLLSSVALVVSFYFLRKPKTRNYSLTKTAT